ncbi:hypothetical protein [Streptomyces abikoensis]|uniref:Immunity protein 50 n=1 Tax=Streptomyces abikoensis TaxID=97398 RepID=A0ABW7T9I9_9ACTN
MQVPLRVQDVKVNVEFYSFGIQEDDDLKVPVPYPDRSEGNVFLKALPMRLDFGSAGHTHTASLRAEVWAQRPDVDNQPAWDEVDCAEIETVTGRLGVWAIGRALDVIDLGAPGTWRVRVTVQGRDEVRHLARTVGPVMDVERWLLQFWPKEVPEEMAL